MRALFAAPILAGLLLTALPAAAQTTPRELYDFDLVLPPNVVEVNVNEQARVEILARDLSRDSTNIVPGAPNAIQVRPHQVRVTAEELDGPQKGWSIGSATPIPASSAGQEHLVFLPIQVILGAERSFFRVNVTLTAETDGGTFVRSGIVVAHTSGVLDLTVNAIGDIEPMAPRDIATAQVEITNTGLLARTIGAEVMSNPCGLDMAPPAGTTLAASENRIIAFSIQAPGDKVWYYYENCDLQIDIFAADNPSLRKAVTYSVVVDGFYVNPGWIIQGVAWALVILIVVLFVKGVRDRRAELVHAKPQKPWLIPIERVYLDQLKKEDPRAWYVVRHYLMEDEYRSALGWWRSYRAADKGGLSKERLILKEEASYGKWKAKWAKRIAAPLKKAGRMETHLARKRGKQVARKHKKEVGAHEAREARIQATDAKRHARDVAAWEKQAAKAAKKGFPAPARPQSPSSATKAAPPAPVASLEGHRFGRKMERVRRRAIRKQGNLEVRFENADARRQERMRNRIERLARKLDDDQFAREHGVGS